MTNNATIYRANDCSPFDWQQDINDVMPHFLNNVFNEKSIFKFSSKAYDDDLLPASFFQGKWCAGRLVGEASFKLHESDIKIEIAPRFGELSLFRMLEEIFSINILMSKNQIIQKKDESWLLKKIISFIWVQKLANANKYGVPSTNVTRPYIGSTIKGKINIRKSIIPLSISSQVFSYTREKIPDEIIAQIILQAYDILQKHYGLSNSNISENALNAIQNFEGGNFSKRIITQSEYQRIRYKSIYLSYKEVVDFSWQIIRNKEFSASYNNEKEGFSFFVDMAEIWELYLLSVMRKRFKKSEWQISSEVVETYREKDYRRPLIPDIVLKRGQKLAVFDAKYKRMNFVYSDFDRIDFFQIHTYMGYYRSKSELICGGLLYPLSSTMTKELQNRNSSSSLFDNNQDNVQFLIDGINLSIVEDEDSFQYEIQVFLDRIDAYLNLTSDFSTIQT